jgi:predicted RecB family nuclease
MEPTMTSSALPITITKSKFVAGCQCLKRLYLSVHSPELGSGKTAADFALFTQGREVGLLAHQLFPGGVTVTSGNPAEAIRITQELIANPEVPAIFEGAFVYENLLVRVDILQRQRNDKWRIVEVKSSADLKEDHYHLEDVAVQCRVVSRCGLQVGSCWLAHVNRKYVFEGGNIEAKKFFKLRNLTRRVQRLQPKLTFQLRSEFRVLAMPEAPDLTVGRHCTNPVTCEFYEVCNKPRPSEHVGYLPYIHASAVEKLEEIGVESIHEIPDDFELTEAQRRAATCVQTGQPWFDSDELKKELATLNYPIFFMDFESVNPAIPRCQGMRPFDHFCFQYSVHVVREPGAEAEHYEFLAEDRRDHRRQFISFLCDVLREHGSILVYNQQFESARLSDLAAWLPEFAERINDIKARLFDLLPVVRNYCYHPLFAGSYSLKSVLPALVQNMSYENLEVGNGQDAGLAFEMLLRNSDPTERGRLRKALLAYCRQDTLSLVRILERLRAEADRPAVAQGG